MNNIIPMKTPIDIKDWIGVKLVIANPKDLEFVPENSKVIYDELQTEGFLWAVDLQELGITIDINNLQQLQDELIRLGHVRKVSKNA
jgi:hypothetical protein